MPSLFRRVTQVLLVAAMPLVPASVWAQSPAPNPPPTQDPVPPPVQDPVPPPVDDGPKPAGVGSSQPPAPEEELPPTDAPEALPPTSFPGVPLLGTAASPRPFTGLFAGAVPRAKRTHSLSLSGSVFAAYSTNVAPASSGGQPNPAADEASRLAGGTGSIDYSRSWTSGAVGASLTGGRSYVEAYRGIRDPWITRWDADVNGGFAKQLSRRVRFGLSGDVAYSPYVSFQSLDLTTGNISSLPTDTAGLDYALAYDPSIRTMGTGSLSYAINRKSSLEAYYNAYFQNFVGSDPLNFDRRDQTAGARYRYQFGRFVGVRAGYGYRRTSLGGPESVPISIHYIDAGLDAGYGRSYALTRRTTFSFNTDSGLYADEAASPGAQGNLSGGRTNVFVGGSADLVHTMGRSWAARTGYRRRVAYDVGFDRPLLSDTAFGSLGGLITPRLDANASAYYTAGHVGFSGSDNGYTTSSAVAGLRLAITRNLAAYTQYFYYHYRFDQGVSLPGFLRPSLDRQGVSVGLTASLPLIGSRGRR
jgi:hypothetical protein